MPTFILSSLLPCFLASLSNSSGTVNWTDHLSPPASLHNRISSVSVRWTFAQISLRKLSPKALGKLYILCVQRRFTLHSCAVLHVLYYFRCLRIPSIALESIHEVCALFHVCMYVCTFIYMCLCVCVCKDPSTPANKMDSNICVAERCHISSSRLHLHSSEIFDKFTDRR